MHIEKNVCDSIIGTLLHILEKTKDGLKVRIDMENESIRPKLWPKYNIDEKRAYFPRVCYTLSKEDKMVLCECLYNIKLPTRYSLNMKRLVFMADTKLNGMNEI